MGRWQVAEDALVSFLPKGDDARRGSTWFGRLGDIAQQPPVWAGVAGVLALAAGPRGRRAALRGSVCYAVTAVAGNVVMKPLVARSRPPASGKSRSGPATSSFPSGHAATDLAFAIGAAQELPIVFFPLAAATTAAHWSLVRSRGHYPTDVIAGGILGIVVALAAWKLWPPGGSDDRLVAEARTPDAEDEAAAAEQDPRPTSGS